MTEANPYKLAAGIRPIRYRILLSPDLESLKFSGKEEIELDLDASTSEIKVNLVDLELQSVAIAQGGSAQSASWTLDKEMETVTFSFPNPLSQGNATLSIEFEGELWAGLAGFYHSVYTDANGEKKTIATTQFESTDARRAFPCFDEPEMKAVFSISIEADSDLLVVSNYPEESSVPSVKPGKKVVTFQDTMKMSSYLVAFVVGDLEATEETYSGSTPIRVIHPRGKGHLCAFAHEVADHALRFFTDWYQIEYPAPKLDLLAIPDFAAGAMENLGAVTFRENALLIDPSSASVEEMMRVAEVVCHELAHMWFGDLVTMKWWNGLWLNEAFATYMSYAALDAFKPEWKVWENFAIGTLMSQEIDSLSTTRPIEYPVVSPADAGGMFDLLTYEKGGSILRMIEQYLGIERFKNGIRLYLKRHAYANAETTDLWDALEEATGEPVRKIMDTWIFQGGHPVVSAKRSGSKLAISQSPFRYLSRESDPKGAIGDSWQVPMSIGTGSGGGENILLGAETALIESTTPAPLINLHGSGFFRSRYESELAREISNRYGTLETLERLKFVSDTVSLVQAEMLDLSEAIGIARNLTSERDPNVLGVLQSLVANINRIALEPERPLVAKFAREVFGEIYEAFGFSASESDSPQDRVSRSIAIDVMGIVGGDSEVKDLCFDAFRQDMAGDTAIDSDIASSVIKVVSYHGDETEFAFMLDRYRHPSTPQEEMRFLNGLAGFSQSRLASRLASMCLGEIRSQNAPFVLARAMANRFNSEIILRFLEENFEAMKDQFPTNALPRMLDSFSTFYAEENYRLAPEVRQFVKDHPLAMGQKTVDQALEKLEVGLRFRQNYSGRLSQYLK
ncbi:MAG: M1 family metallopeptidase [Acidimicrobiaceae bacterium]|nr:M1 family metallopeptidase [Acidimicrobiaceae bacterium]